MEGRTEHGLDFAGSGHFVFCVCVDVLCLWLEHLCRFLLFFR